MAILDASALIAALTGEPASDEVGQLLKAGARINAANVVEVYDRLIRGGDSSVELVEQSFKRLGSAQGLAVVPLDEPTAARAGVLRATHYHRARRDVSNADCVALATAESFGEAIATSDADLKAMAEEEEVTVIALPDSTGKRP